MSSLIQSVREEVGQLERELERHPAWVKLMALRKILELYGEAHQDDVPKPEADAAPTVGQVQREVPASDGGTRPPRFEGTGRRKPAGAIGGNAGIAARASVQVLRTHQGWMTTAEILEALGLAGVTFKGATPLNELSSILSRTSEIESKRGKGWRLVTDSTAKETADSERPGEDTLPAAEPQSTPVKPGEEVAHEQLTLP